MMGLADSTNDVDLHVTAEAWMKLVEDPNKVVYLGDGVFLYPLTENIDIHIGGFTSEDFVKAEKSAEGVMYRNFIDTVYDYIRLQRTKDIERLVMFKNILLERLDKEKYLAGDKEAEELTFAFYDILDTLVELETASSETEEA